MSRRFLTGALWWAVTVALAGGAAAQDEPELPAGLEQAVPAKKPAQAPDEPELPTGLEPAQPATHEPGLPEGLAAEEEKRPEDPAIPEGLEKEEGKPAEEKKVPRLQRLPFELSGFLDLRVGARTQDDRYEKDVSLGEARLQLDVEKAWKGLTFKLVTDFLLDPVSDSHHIHLEEGRGWVDLRQANVAFSPAEVMDVKVGRQILTWGTGDLLFINDLFPKDWNAFFIGRDVEYLKAPSDAVKVSLFSKWANVDVVYSPRHDADRFIDGRRISYWNAMLGRRAGRDAIVREDRRDDWFGEDEIAVRLYRNLKGYEVAAYGYHGYWKSPMGTNAVSGRATFPRLSVWGASVRGAVLKGIANLEVGYYDSRDDRGGNNPLVANSEVRFLAGYEQEIAAELTAGVQYYLEYMTDYGAYRRTLPAGVRARDEDRHVLTLRLTKLLMNQNLKLSLFVYYSPSDDDGYLRPNVHYKVNDHWSVQAGANVFVGDHPQTFFGQFERNTNFYAGARYSF